MLRPGPSLAAAATFAVAAAAVLVAGCDECIDGAVRACPCLRAVGEQTCEGAGFGECVCPPPRRDPMPEPPPPRCGDSFCDPGEAGLCLVDCGDLCEDGVCGFTESTASCPSDCPPLCGDGICNGGESTATCTDDCPVVCGDGRCDPDESCDVDCPNCIIRGAPVAEVLAVTPEVVRHDARSGTSLSPWLAWSDRTGVVAEMPFEVHLDQIAFDTAMPEVVQRTAERPRGVAVADGAMVWTSADGQVRLEVATALGLTAGSFPLGRSTRGTPDLIESEEIPGPQLVTTWATDTEIVVARWHAGAAAEVARRAAVVVAGPIFASENTVVWSEDVGDPPETHVFIAVMLGPPLDLGPIDPETRPAAVASEGRWWVTWIAAGVLHVAGVDRTRDVRAAEAPVPTAVGSPSITGTSSGIVVALAADFDGDVELVGARLSDGDTLRLTTIARMGTQREPVIWTRDFSVYAAFLDDQPGGTTIAVRSIAACR